MENFNWNRFLRMLRYTFLYNKAALIKIFTTFFIVFSVINLLIGGVLFGSTNTPVSINSCSGLTYAIFLVYFALSPSWIVSNMKSKQAAIDYLMLPASNFEKFIARIIFVMVFCQISFWMAAVAADVLQWLVSLIRYPVDETGSVVWDCLFGIDVNNISFGNSEGGTLFASFAGLLVFIWGHSVYTLGGVLFRKSPWVLTSLFMLVISLLFAAFVSLSIGAVYKSDYYLELETVWVKWVVAIVLIALIVINYVTSYFLFKRLQVVNRKLINY